MPHENRCTVRTYDSRWRRAWEAPDDDEGGHTWTQHLFLAQFDALELHGTHPRVAKLEFEARVRGNLDGRRYYRAVGELDGEDRIFISERCLSKKNNADRGRHQADKRAGPPLMSSDRAGYGSGSVFMRNSMGVLMTAVSRRRCGTQLSPNQNKRRIIRAGRHGEAHIAFELDSGAVFADLDRLDGVEAQLISIFRDV